MCADALLNSALREETHRTTENAVEPAMNMHTDSPLLLKLMVSKKVSFKKMTPEG